MGLRNNIVVLPPPSDIIVILFVVPNAPLLATRHQRPRKGAKILLYARERGPPYKLAKPHVVRFFPSELGKGSYDITLSSTTPHLLRSSGSQALRLWPLFFNSSLTCRSSNRERDWSDPERKGGPLIRGLSSNNMHWVLEHSNREGKRLGSWKTFLLVQFFLFNKVLILIYLIELLTIDKEDKEWYVRMYNIILCCLFLSHSQRKHLCPLTGLVRRPSPPDFCVSEDTVYSCKTTPLPEGEDESTAIRGGS